MGAVRGLREIEGPDRTSVDLDFNKTRGCGVSCVTDNTRGLPPSIAGLRRGGASLYIGVTGRLTIRPLLPPYRPCEPLTFRRGRGKNSASHHVSADSQRSEPVAGGGDFVRCCAGRLPSAASDRFGVEMEDFSCGAMGRVCAARCMRGSIA